MQGLLSKFAKLGLKIGKKIILTLAYFLHFCLKRQKLALPFKKTVLITGASLFVVFSYSQTAVFSQQKFLNKLTIPNKEIFIEKGVPYLKNDSPNKTPDFQIAAWREDDIIDLSDDSEISLILGNSALVAPETEIKESDLKQPTRTEIETYIVQPGDTISSIAEGFGLKWTTILWENKLNYWSVIRPGDKLKILPIDGLSYEIKKGDTLSFLAKKYQSSLQKIAEFNNINEEEILQPGEIIILPDASPPPTPAPKPKYTPIVPQLVQENYSNYWDWRKNTSCHLFVARQCTDWSAFKWATEQNQCVPSWGNAKSWLANAKRDGYETSSSPRNGAIIVLTCTSWICNYYGHVAYVENFDQNSITISEMNGLKRREYSQRTLINTNQWQNGWKILGYIYPKK